MKRFVHIALALTILALAGSACKKESKSIDPTGEWKLSSVSGVAAESIGDGLDVYICFDGKQFASYERIPNSDKFKKYSGTYCASGNTLTGTYDDGTLWGNRYEAHIKGNTLSMKAGSGTYEYTKTSIPQTVLDNSSDGALFKSVLDEIGKFL